MIDDGRVRVPGRLAIKPATGIGRDESVVVSPAAHAGPDYVSRGAHKLVGALDAFGVDVAGRRCLDAGASTGGFTDVLLRRGAAEVVAVDVGYGLLAWSLQTDDRVRVVDRMNARTLTPEVVGPPVEVVVADLSFISLRLVLPALAAAALPGADLMPMVKPQFEVGRSQVGAGGVVRDPVLRRDAVLQIARFAGTIGYGVAGVTASPLPGPAGNVEYFLHLRRDAPPVDAAAVEAAVGAGPTGEKRPVSGNAAAL